MCLVGDDTIQGVIALEPREDHVYIHLIESAPRNRNGGEFDLVGEHLIAFACKRSKELGFEGYVAFQSKTSAELMEYYQRVIGATHIGRGRMIIDDSVAA